MRFCGSCGKRLPGTTSQLQIPTKKQESVPDQIGVMMGSDLLERFRQAGLDAAGQKRVVTIMIADIVGFTRMSQEVDNEEIYVLIQQFSGLIAKDVYRYDGMVDKYMGDGVMAIFGAPIAVENSAEMALRAAMDILDNIITFSAQVQERLGFGLNLHIGLHTGPVIVGSIGSNLMMNYTAIGDTVNLAARLQQNSPPDTIIVSESTFTATQPLFDFQPLPSMQLKGIAGPVVSYRALGLKSKPGAIRGIEGLTAPMVGRTRELAAIMAITDKMADGKRGGMVIIDGEGGIGKSRLISEFRRSLKRLPDRILAGHSYIYRRTISYWIFQDILRSYFNYQPGIGDAQARKLVEEKCLEVLGHRAAELVPYFEIILQIGDSSDHFRYLEAVQLRQQIFLAVRELFEAEAHLHPLILLFDNLHWADETSLEMIRYLTGLAATSPVMLLAVTRPVQEGWLTRLVDTARSTLGSDFQRLTITSLSDDQSQELFSNLLNSPNFPHELQAQVVLRAGGNPFYLEEIIRMLIDQKVILREGRSWCLAQGADTSLKGVPDTLQGLILARFDRLTSPQRHVLQVASAIGRSFYSRLLKMILRGMDPGTVQDILVDLQARGFIESNPNFEDADYTFSHVLVSDAIYSTLLRADRSELHGQIGEALERLYSQRLGEMTELLARHYSWSTRYDRALHYLILAGQIEKREYANQQAQHHFGQALEILGRIQHTPWQALQVRQGLGDVLLFTGDYRSALATYQAALDELAAVNPTDMVVETAALHRKVGSSFERLGEYDHALTSLATARNILTQQPDSDPSDLARILNDTGWIYFRRGHLENSEKNFQQALSLVENSEFHDIIASIYNRLGGICYQKNQLDQAREYVRRSLAMRRKTGDLSGEARSSNNLGLLGWQGGDWDEALEAFSHSAALHSRLGDVEGTIEIEINLGLLLLDRGNFLEAFDHLQHALRSARKIGHIYNTGIGYYHLSRYYLHIGEWHKAIENCQRSMEVFRDAGVEENWVNTNTYLGRAWLGLGDPERSRQYAIEALKIFSGLAETNQIIQIKDKAHALRLLGRIDLLSNKLEQAETALEESAVIFRATGSLIERARADYHLAELAAARGDNIQRMELLTRALPIFQKLGANSDIQKIEGML